jgi:hypothetical protein
MAEDKNKLQLDEAGVEEVVTDNPQTGRAKMLAIYKQANPELTDEPDDEALYNYGAEAHGKHKRLAEANGRLADLMTRDPRLAAAIGMIAGDEPKSLPYAIGKVYGKDAFKEETDLEEFEQGYQESLQRLAESEKLLKQAQENIKTYEDALLQYGKDNSLTDEEVDAIHAGVIELANNILMGNIPVTLIELIHKGQNYDKDVAAAADTGYIEGKNEKIDAKMKNFRGGAMPDLSATTGAGGGRTAPVERPKKSFFDGMEEVPV